MEALLRDGRGWLFALTSFLVLSKWALWPVEFSTATNGKIAQSCTMVIEIEIELNCNCSEQFLPNERYSSDSTLSILLVFRPKELHKGDLLSCAFVSTLFKRSILKGKLTPNPPFEEVPKHETKSEQGDLIAD